VLRGNFSNKVGQLYNNTTGVFQKKDDTMTVFTENNGVDLILWLLA
jgi:hypothetical protein